jgi:transposase
VEDAFDQSQRTTKVWDDLSRHVSRDEGLLAVQYQRHENNPRWKPMIASSLVGGSDTFVQIGGELIGKPTKRAASILGETVKSRLDEAMVGNQGTADAMANLSPQELDELEARRVATPMPTGAKRLRTLRFRIGSNGRQPIWANLYTLMHRPLPEARVTWVKLSCRRTGLRYRWQLLVVVDEECRGTPDPQRAATVGVDIGWRKHADGSIRVAYWVGSDGREGELAIPEVVHQRKGKSDSLRAIRDRERNEVAARWRQWIFGSSAAVTETETETADPDPGAGTGIPVSHPVRVAAVAMHAWSRMGRYLTLARIWRDNRIPGDEELFDRVQAWFKHDRHLLAWDAHNRRRMALQIQGRVDDLAVRLARQYEVVAVEKRGMVPDLIKKNDAHDQDEERLRALSAARTSLVAPASMRMALERHAKKYGALYREVDPAYTTRDCAECGAEREIGDTKDLRLTCNRCGASEDQDRTAGRNIGRRARAQVDAERAEALAPESTGSKPKKLGPRRNRRKVVAGPLENAAVSPPSDS